MGAAAAEPGPAFAQLLHEHDQGGGLDRCACCPGSPSSGSPSCCAPT